MAIVAEKPAFIEAAVAEHDLALQAAPETVSRYSATTRERIGKTHRVFDANGNRLHVVYDVESCYLPLKDKDPELEYQFITVWNRTYDQRFPTAWLIEYLQQERLTPQTQMEDMTRNVHPLVEHAAWVLDPTTLPEQDDLGRCPEGSSS